MDRIVDYVWGPQNAAVEPPMNLTFRAGNRQLAVVQFLGETLPDGPNQRCFEHG
jgi:hypothetical protein